jgi:hypothetical protein
MLQIAIFLLTTSALQVSSQEDTCTDVQQKLQALTESVQTLCGSSTPQPTTITTSPAPIVQQCDCSPTLTWTSVPMTSIGSSTLQHTGTVAYDIPSVIPDSAKEVLVLASAIAGISGPNDRTHYIRIYTEQDQKQYENYIFLTSYNQNAYHTINSDNLWFPMTTGRQMFVRLAYAHTGFTRVFLHAIGYR